MSNHPDPSVRESRAETSSRRMPKITVIVATYNSLRQLKPCLDSIHKQEYPGELELVVSDGGSTDGSIELAKFYQARILNNSLVSELGFTGGKNLAIRHSDGPLVAIVDADNVLVESDYLRRMAVPLLEDPSVSLSVPMPQVPHPSDFTAICRYFACVERDYWQDISKRGLRRGDWIQVSPPSAVVPNGGVLRRSLLDSVGGWDYDTEVAARLILGGYGKFAIVPGAHRLHLEAANYGDVWKKFQRRIRHQVAHHAEKPVVQNEMKMMFSNPVFYVKDELADRLGMAFRHGDPCYFQAIPVFLIKSLLVVLHLREIRRALSSWADTGS